MGFSASLRRLIVQDPVIAFSCTLAGIGLLLPLVVPPIKNAIIRPDPGAPPQIKDVVSGMTGKS